MGPLRRLEIMNLNYINAGKNIARICLICSDLEIIEMHSAAKVLI
jgi:hypothetical protein